MGDDDWRWVGSVKGCLVPSPRRPIPVKPHPDATLYEVQAATRTLGLRLDIELVESDQ